MSSEETPVAPEHPLSSRQVRALLLLGILAISSASLWTRWLRDFTVAATVVAGLRMLFASALTLPAACAVGRVAPSRFPRGLILLAGVALAVHFGAYTAALYHTSVARAVLLTSTQPIAVVLGSWWWWRERPTPATLGWLGVTGLGIAVMLLPQRQAGAWTGDGWALLSALSLGVYLMCGRQLRRHGPATSYTTPLYAIAGVLLLAVAFACGEEVFRHPPAVWGLLGGLALVPTLLGHSVFHVVMQRVSATTVSLAFLGEVPGSALLAAVLLGEIPDRWTMLGGTIALIGLAGAVLGPQQRNRVRTA